MASLSFRLLTCCTLATLAASCSDGQLSKPRGESRESDASSTPDISPSAAPGVAFNYSYDYRLPNDRISQTQERHAAACEQLGLAKCRITGMSYSLDDRERVTARLNLKLAPAIARNFGKSATSLVHQSEGRLDALEIGSSDEGARIATANRERASLNERIAKAEAELAQAGNAPQRVALTQQLDSLRAEAARQAAVIIDSEEVLATTPMNFNYYSDEGAPGFRDNPLKESWHLFVGTVIAMIGFVLRALAVIVPLAILTAFLVLLWRSWPIRRIRRWLREDDSGSARDAGDPASHA